MADQDNLEELEELNELEELVDDDEFLSEDIETDEAPLDNKKFLSASANPYINSIFPVLFINKKMRILYANPACENLFTGFFKITGNYFIDVFGRAFDIEDIRNIRQVIMEGENGYTWKGKAKIKSRSMATLQVRVYIFPLELSSADHNEFIVMFDDVTEENKKLLRSVFMSLLEASILKDNDTGKHIIRVNYYAKRIAEELFRCDNPQYNRIDADFIDNLGFLASMHDVGKIGTPDDILNKEGPLSDDEWYIMREHTKNGAFILSTYPNPIAKEIALSHHEHWDGSGYPYQLSKESIPLSARIVSIADVYDALRMERKYKPALDHNTAVEKMNEGREKHFDPYLMDIFDKITNDFNNIYEMNQDN